MPFRAENLGDPFVVATGGLEGGAWVREEGATWEPARRAPFLAEAWVSGDLPETRDREMAVAGQLQLRRGAALAAQLDLALGAELRRFRQTWSYDEFGQGPEDFADQRLGMSASQVQELAIVSRKLEELPFLRAAFLAGALTRSKVRDLVRVVTPATERAWTNFALGRSVRELASAIAEWKRAGRPDGVAAVGDEVSAEMDRVS